jgi:hypothetical protein
MLPQRPRHSPLLIWIAICSAAFPWLMPMMADANPVDPGGPTTSDALALYAWAVPQLLAEVVGVQWLFRKRALARGRMWALLILMNLATWSVFTACMANASSSWLFPMVLPVLEAPIVVVEGLGIYLIARACATRRPPPVCVTVPEALKASLLVNMGSLMLGFLLLCLGLRI